MGIITFAIVLAVVGVLVGWLVPLVGGRRRPYGLATDVSASTLVMLVVGLVEYFWLASGSDLEDWDNWLALLAVPLVIALALLWLMRRTSSGVPQDEGAQADTFK